MTLVIDSPSPSPSPEVESASKLFEGLLFHVQYIGRPAAYARDIRQVLDLKGDVTRFPLCRKPTYVIVEIPGHPRFHTYSLPAEVPPVRQWQGVWSLDQIIDNFAPPEGNSDTVVVQVQWIEECIRAGKVLGSDDEWGGWRVCSRRLRASPEPAESKRLTRSPRGKTPSNDGGTPTKVKGSPRKKKTTRKSKGKVPSRKRARVALSSEDRSSCPPLLSPMEVDDDGSPSPTSRRLSSLAPEVVSAENASEHQSLSTTRATSEQVETQAQRMAGFKPITASGTAPFTTVVAKQSAQSVAGASPGARSKVHSDEQATTAEAPDGDVEVDSDEPSFVLQTPDTSFEAELPHSPSPPHYSASGVRLRSPSSLVTSQASGSDSSHHSEPQPGAIILPDRSPVNYGRPPTSIHTEASHEEEMFSNASMSKHVSTVPTEANSSPDPPISARTSDSVESLVSDLVLDVEQQVEAVLQANRSISSPPISTMPMNTPAPVRPEGISGMFSFGLTRPLTFFVTEGTEPGIVRMITMAGGVKTSVNKARFVIVPGKVGDDLTPEQQKAVQDVGPWGRVVHEQWIKHCFRDECIVNPDNYLANLSVSPVYIVSDDEDDGGDGQDDRGEGKRDDDMPPADALQRIQQIIDALREWKAAGRPGRQHRTVYSFVDNLAGTRGIKNAALLYRTYRAYIARVAPDVAKAPKD